MKFCNGHQVFRPDAGFSCTGNLSLLLDTVRTLLIACACAAGEGGGGGKQPVLVSEYMYNMYNRKTIY